MSVLGISYGYHDASACLVMNGRVLAAAAEERFTRQKHDANFPAHAVEWLLRENGIRAADLDHVVFHEDPHAKFARVLCTVLAPFPGSRQEFVNSMKSWLGRKLWSLNQISARLDLPPEKISYLSHHFSHAVQAFMGSGYRESAILVVDAVGDWASTALYRGAWDAGRPRVERIVEIAFPNSLGLVYSAFTAWLGFVPNDAECSTMALAAFGQPSYADKVREIIRKVDGEYYDVDQRYFNFTKFYRGAYTERFLEAFGAARSPKDPLPFTCFGPKKQAGADAQRWADVAASLQLVLEERLVDLALALHEKAPSENLCLAGGVSLNCVANARLLAETPFRSAYIPPDPGDGGTAVGIALYRSALEGGAAPESTVYTPYLGPGFDEARDVAMIDHVRPEHVLRYLKKGLEQPTAGRTFAHRTFSDVGALSSEVAARLARGNIVGWYQGRAELGPRALGNRSILIRPDDVELGIRLSRFVKDRATFRPYALSITEEDAPEVLDLPPEKIRMHRWMQYAAPVKASARERMRVALHVDGTTRAQVCSRGDNPRYHGLLTAAGELLGTSALLNTSFNASGYPLVSTPVEALTMFARTDMDILVLNDVMVWKQ